MNLQISHIGSKVRSFQNGCPGEGQSSGGKDWSPSPNTWEMRWRACPQQYQHGCERQSMLWAWEKLGGPQKWEEILAIVPLNLRIQSLLLHRWRGLLLTFGAVEFEGSHCGERGPGVRYSGRNSNTEYIFIPLCCGSNIAACHRPTLQASQHATSVLATPPRDDFCMCM